MQPAAAAILSLRRLHPALSHADVESVEVESFHEAVALSCRAPAETDAAQYSLPFVVAATLVHGRLTAAEIAGAGLRDAAVLRFCRTMSLVETEEFNRPFPGERWARVRLTLHDGTVLDSGPHTTAGDPDTPLDAEALSGKFRLNAAMALGADAARRVEDLVATPRSGRELGAFLDHVLTAGHANALPPLPRHGAG